jgi:4-hydroxy-4-methyl-2-oxoglutarate aldolase
MHQANEGKSLIEFLRTTDTPTLANAIETLKLRPKAEGFTPLQVRCLFPEFGAMCGYAVTAQVETVTEGVKREEAGYIELFEAVENSLKPAVIALQEIGGGPDYATHCGEVLATIFSRLGGIGLVSDCGVRDIAEVQALKFHYFARGAVASHANFHIVRVGVPIQVCGLVIQPQDLLHGDLNGLIQIPKEALADLPDAVASVRAKERRILELTKDPDFSASRLRGRFIH